MRTSWHCQLPGPRASSDRHKLLYQWILTALTKDLFSSTVFALQCTFVLLLQITKEKNKAVLRFCWIMIIHRGMISVQDCQSLYKTNWFHIQSHSVQFAVSRGGHSDRIRRIRRCGEDAERGCCLILSGSQCWKVLRAKWVTASHEAEHNTAVFLKVTTLD